MTPQERSDAVRMALHAAGGDDAFRSAFCYALGGALFLAEQGDDAALRIFEAAVEHTAGHAGFAAVGTVTS